MEGTDSSTSSPQPQLPPGFRFHPTDEELVVHYLKKKDASEPLPVAIIAEVDLYKYDPWELPAKAAFGENEWYFFSPRDRKYPNGARPNRAATSGYWKATGTDKPVLTAGGTQKVGVKKALVFYGGKPPKGVKTNWIMHEYRLNDGKSICKPPVYDSSKNRGSLRLDDWVLCRIYKKTNMQRPMEFDGGGGGGDLSMHGVLGSPPPCMSYTHHGLTRPNANSAGYNGYNAMMENHEQTTLLFDNMLNSNPGVNLVDNNHNHNHNAVVSASDHLPGRRSSLPGMFWNEEGAPGNSSSASAYTKMFFTDNTSARSPMDTQPRATAEESNDHMNLLSGMPQVQEQPMLGPPGESIIFRQPYQLPDMNWYSC